MIVVSLLFVCVSAALLGAGVVQSSDGYVLGSIATCLLAAAFLVIGIRQQRALSAAATALDTADTINVREEPQSPGQSGAYSCSLTTQTAPTPGEHPRYNPCVINTEFRHKSINPLQSTKTEKANRGGS